MEGKERDPQCPSYVLVCADRLARISVPLEADSESDAIVEARMKREELKQNPHWKDHDIRLFKEIPLDG